MKNLQNAHLLRNIRQKHYQYARIFMIFAGKINNLPELYMLFARKYPNFI